MESTDLVNFMQYLVKHTEELRQFRQNPAGYIKRTHPQLDQNMQELLINFLAPSLWEEISTVFRLDIDLPPSLALHLEDTDPQLHPSVELSAPSSSIIIEPTIDPTGTDQPLVNRLLLHSFVQVNEQNYLYFQLNPCYVTPEDHAAKPFVFQIKTDPSFITNEQLTYFDASDARITLTATQPIVLIYSRSVCRPLQAGSGYDPKTGRLTINLIPPSLPHS